MPTCFVIQPFDRGVYDQRYQDIIMPAIKEAGLEPYRVDQDPGASIPIVSIENGIRKADLCLAEITTDNPNVWFEVGFALAVRKDLVLICCDDRKGIYPFDVQHHNIIIYASGSSSDFDKLKIQIKERIIAVLKKQQDMGPVSDLSPIKNVEGLSQHEIVALVSIMSNSLNGTGIVSAWQIINDMNKAGYNDVAVRLALWSLGDKRMTQSDSFEDEDGHAYNTYWIAEEGKNWLLSNQNRLVLKIDIKNNDVPF